MNEALEQKGLSGIKTETENLPCAEITRIRVCDRAGSEMLKKPEGTYITAEIPSLCKETVFDNSLIEKLGEELLSLLPAEGTVLVAGLGNENITPDALGPAVCSLVLATRHIKGEILKSTGLEGLRPCAVISPGVLGQTGIETAEIIKGLADYLRPCAVIAVDALAAIKLSRLGNTVQMTDSGIIPGSGVGNRRSELTLQSLGVPVISMGIPTVADAVTFADDITDEGKNMIVTPREIDLVISRGAKLLGMIINRALQPHISVEDMLAITASD